MMMVFRIPFGLSLSKPGPSSLAIARRRTTLRQAQGERFCWTVLAAFALATPATAQIRVDVTDDTTNDLIIAVPVMPTPQVATTAAGATDALGRQVAEVVAADLRGSGLFKPQGPTGVPGIGFDEVTAPQFDRWGASGAAALVQGFVRANADGGITVGCYLYDVALRTELTRAGYVVQPSDWRRAAHKCADAI